MATRRNFLQHGMNLAAIGLVATPLIGCASRTEKPAMASAGAKPRMPKTGVPPQPQQLASIDRSITTPRGAPMFTPDPNMPMASNMPTPAGAKTITAFSADMPSTRAA